MVESPHPPAHACQPSWGADGLVFLGTERPVGGGASLELGAPWVREKLLGSLTEALLDPEGTRHRVTGVLSINFHFAWSGPVHALPRTRWKSKPALLPTNPEQQGARLKSAKPQSCSARLTAHRSVPGTGTHPGASSWASRHPSSLGTEPTIPPPGLFRFSMAMPFLSLGSPKFHQSLLGGQFCL